jgi:predicted DCC family thiol-disulfide oxidoreductase YuxK
MTTPQRTPPGSASEPLMLYDGSCGFCAAGVQFILRHERQHTLRFAALESELGTAVRRRHPELANTDSMVWVEPASSGRQELVTVRSAAVLAAAHYLGGAWRLAAIAWLIPAPIRDALYDLVARHRHRLVRGGERCLLPSPDTRARFLDM